MKTNFIDYLNHLHYYDQQNHRHRLETSKVAVVEALAGDFEQLNRLFFDFPLYYEITLDGESHVFCVVKQSKRERWIQKYENLIAKGNFQVSADHPLPRIIAHPETATQIANFNADILITACADLLDETGNLRPELTDFFGLSTLLARYQQNPVAMQAIINHLVYSYWLEIVNVNLGVIAVTKDCNVIQLEYLNGFSKALLLHHKEFTPFFLAKIAEYKAKFTEIHFATYLRDLPVDRISGTLTIDSSVIDHSEDMRDC